MEALVLASQSPRRRELMALITLDFVVDAADVDENVSPGTPPARAAEDLAALKAAAVFEKRGGGVVIGCDTVVDLDGEILGKPRDEDDAVRMLEALSGRAHAVHTGVCILQGGAVLLRFTDTTEVTFVPIPPAEIRAVAKTPEPYDKAGGYGIQGWAAKYVPGIRGCYYNVMGLPVAALYQALHGLGLA